MENLKRLFTLKNFGWLCTTIGLIGTIFYSQNLITPASTLWLIANSSFTVYNLVQEKPQIAQAVFFLVNAILNAIQLMSWPQRTIDDKPPPKAREVVRFRAARLSNSLYVLSLSEKSSLRWMCSVHWKTIRDTPWKIATESPLCPSFFRLSADFFQ